MGRKVTFFIMPVNRYCENGKDKSGKKREKEREEGETYLLFFWRMLYDVLICPE